MSIINSIANVRRPFSSGCDRSVFFSKKHNVVIKTSHNPHDTEQSEKEEIVFNTMTEEDKEVFPIISVIWHKGVIHIIMKRCIPLNKYVYKNNLYPRGHTGNIVGLDALCTTCRLSLDNNVRMMDFIKRYKIHDLHYANLGIDEQNRLVILDAGY